MDICRCISFRMPACVLATILLMPWGFCQDLQSILGRVVDTKNTAIPAAVVRLWSQDPGPPAETLTEVDGSFSFHLLPPGAYRLVVQMPGFQDLTREGMDPADEASRLLTLVLLRPTPAVLPAPDLASLAPAAPVASNVAPAPAPPAPDTPTPLAAPAPAAAAAFVLPPAFQAVTLAEMQGEGEANPLHSSYEDPFRDAPLADDDSEVLYISGQSTASVHAVDWNDTQDRARMQELASRMGFGGAMAMPEDEDSAGARRSAADGRTIGPSIMSGGVGRMLAAKASARASLARGAKTKKQSQLNGSLSYQYANSALNARNFSLTGKDVPKPLQIQNRFTLSAGGPLPWGASAGYGARIKQGGSWFFTYSGSRDRNPFDILTTVPSELERSGDFSETTLRGAKAGQPITLFDPAAAQPMPFSGNRIPASRMNPAALELVKFLPLPNLPGAVQNYTRQQGTPDDSHSYSAKLSLPVSTKDSLSFSYSYRSGSSLRSGLYPGLESDRTSSGQSIGLNATHRFARRLSSNYRISLNRGQFLTTNPFSFVDDVAGRLGITGVSGDPINFGIPRINFTNFGDLRLTNPALLRTQSVAIGGGLNRIGSRHTILTGAGASFNQRRSQLDPDARGTFDFTGFATSAFNAKGRPIAATGYDFADFLLGLPYASSRRFGSSNNYLRNGTFNFHVMDNWRVRPNITLNIGLRYEYIEPYWEKYDHLVSLDATPGFTAVEQVFPNQVGPYRGERYPRSLLFGDKNNFGPRIGVAWKPRGKSRWVFRAGWSMFYNPSVYSYISSQLVGQPPFALSQDILTSPEQPLTLQRGFPVDPDVTIRNSYAIDPHYRIGYVQQWSLNVQTQAFKLYALEIGYNAAKGTRLDLLRAPNRAPSGSAPGSTELNRTISNAGSFVYQESGANSILHSLQVRVTRRYSQGFRLESSYTLGKSIDNASGVGGSSLAVVQNELDLRAERSLSSFDVRHKLQTAFSFELPFGTQRKFFSGARPFVSKLISGWTLTGSHSIYSGLPLTPRLAGNVSNNSGTGAKFSERPDNTGTSVALPRRERTPLRYFNTDAFAIPPPGAFGNAARNSIPGPGTNLLHLTLYKRFRLDDSNRRLEVRWRITNALNHPNFRGLSTVVNSNSFGRVTNAGAMRRMEFTLKLYF